MRRLFRFFVLALYVVALLVVTLAPLPADAYEVTEIPGLDKAVHFVLFGGLAVVWSWTWAGSPQARPGFVVGMAIVLAGVVEVFQAPLPFRTGDVWDFVWGGAGVAAASLVLGVLQARRVPG